MLIEYKWSWNILPRARTYRQNVCVQLESIKDHTMQLVENKQTPVLQLKKLKTTLKLMFRFLVTKIGFENDKTMS